jgi:hypothetical protein
VAFLQYSSFCIERDDKCMVQSPINAFFVRKLFFEFPTFILRVKTEVSRLFLVGFQYRGTPMYMCVCVYVYICVYIYIGVFGIRVF